METSQDQELQILQAKINQLKVKATVIASPYDELRALINQLETVTATVIQSINRRNEEKLQKAYQENAELKSELAKLQKPF
jgi:prefoldin subunit 5